MKILTHKQRALLYTLNKLNDRNIYSKFMLVKNLFLLSEEEQLDSFIKFYHFFPYRYGPFSNMCYTDVAKLEKAGFIMETESGLNLTSRGKEASKKLESKVKFRINKVTNRFDSNKQIKDYVYKKYPKYTVNSELIVTEKSKQSPGIFTICYEGRDIDKFLNILVSNEIDTLIDVRRNPFSMKFSFTKNKLNNYLGKIGIKYLHIPELGIEGEERKNLITLKDYKELFVKYNEDTLNNNIDKVKEIIELGNNHRLALMCFEADIETCHRGVIAEKIKSLTGLEVTDI
jgi:uncharacterized protein (DUF488 family)